MFLFILFLHPLIVIPGLNILEEGCTYCNVVLHPIIRHRTVMVGHHVGSQEFIIQEHIQLLVLKREYDPHSETLSHGCDLLVVPVIQFVTDILEYPCILQDGALHSTKVFM